MNSVDFGVLPPHFVGPVLSVVEWESVLPGFQAFYPSTFRCVLPFLLASIVHHRDYLRTTLHASHPFFLSLLWTSGVVDKLSPKVELGSMTNCASSLSASGIPPHVTLGYRLSKVESGLADLASSVQAGFQLLPDQLCSSVVAALADVPSVEVNRSSIDDELCRRTETLFNQVESFLQRSTVSTTAATHSQLDISACCGNEETAAWQTWTYGGKIHVVPEGFIFPTCKVIDMWNLWWLGIPTQRIGPLRRLKSWDVSRAAAGNLSKARHVVHTIVSFSSLDASHVQRLSAPLLHEQFGLCFRLACEWVYDSLSMNESCSKNVDDISYVTFYSAIKRKQKTML